MSHDNTWRYLGNVCGGAISFTAGAKFLGAHESSCLLASVVGAFVGFFVARLVIAADRSLFWTTAAPTVTGYYWLHEPPTKSGETTGARPTDYSGGGKVFTSEADAYAALGRAVRLTAEA